MSATVQAAGPAEPPTLRSPGKRKVVVSPGGGMERISTGRKSKSVSPAKSPAKRRGKSPASKKPAKSPANGSSDESTDDEAAGDNPGETSSEAAGEVAEDTDGKEPDDAAESDGDEVEDKVLKSGKGRAGKKTARKRGDEDSGGGGDDDASASDNGDDIPEAVVDGDNEGVEDEGDEDAAVADAKSAAAPKSATSTRSSSPPSARPPSGSAKPGDEGADSDGGGDGDGDAKAEAAKAAGDKGARKSDAPKKSGKKSGRSGGKPTNPKGRAGDKARPRNPNRKPRESRDKGRGSKDTGKRRGSKLKGKDAADDEKKKHARLKHKTPVTIITAKQNDKEISGLSISVGMAEELVWAPVAPGVPGADGDSLPVEDAVTKSAMVTMSLGKSTAHTRRKYSTTTPNFQDELFLPHTMVNESTGKLTSEQTLVVEVFGNARIRKDGRLANDFLGGSVLDVTQFKEDDTAAGDKLTVTISLVSAENIEPYLPKSFRERKKHKDHAPTAQHISDTKCLPATDLQDSNILDGMTRCGSITFSILRTKKKQSEIQGSKFGDDEEDDIKHMSDPRDSKYSAIRRELMRMVHADTEETAPWPTPFWADLDPYGIGLVGASYLLKTIQDRWKLIGSEVVLLRSLAKVQNAPVTRRSWVEPHEYLRIITAMYVMKRICDHIPGVADNRKARIEQREFKFVLSRIGYTEEDNSTKYAAVWFNSAASTGYAVKKASNRSVEREGVTSKFQDAKKKTQGSTKTSANPSVTLDDAAVFVAGQMFWPNESKNQLQEMVAKETAKKNTEGRIMKSKIRAKYSVKDATGKGKEAKKAPGSVKSPGSTGVPGSKKGPGNKKGTKKSKAA